MRAIRLVGGAMFGIVCVLSLAACGSTQSAGSKQSAQANQSIMPNVKGEHLDVAENDIKSEGFDPDKIKIVGGGTFGIVDKSNWEVCSQSPRAGQNIGTTLQLTVDRSCNDNTTTSAPTQPDDEQTLTAENSKDLASLLQVSDPGDSSIAAFANKYVGRTIEFDATIAAVGPHENANTLEDVLLLAGDDANAAMGPQFELSGVSIYNVPAGGTVGEHVRIKAKVGEYDSEPQLFYLDTSPITITDRN